MTMTMAKAKRKASGVLRVLAGIGLGMLAVAAVGVTGYGAVMLAIVAYASAGEGVVRIVL